MSNADLQISEGLLRIKNDFTNKKGDSFHLLKIVSKSKCEQHGRLTKTVEEIQVPDKIPRTILLS
uniref:Uncharacterized protein n=1 Tax=Romanomermis culicivorax TaxID=13658 RepID=A0A915HXU4_ROMCU